MKKKQKKKLYEDQFWYINTYESLGSLWLLKSLEKLGMRKSYILVNLSANAGYYEKDVYEIHKNVYSPVYYIGDLFASKLKDEKVESYEAFNYIPGDNDAASIDVETIPDKADIIVDCKGAIWHTIEDKPEMLLQLMENYRKLLRTDESFLVIDYYIYPALMHMYMSSWWKIKDINNKKQKVKYFGEKSTYKYLRYIYSSRMLKGLFKPLDVQEYIKGKPLSGKMNTAYITRKGLDILIEALKNMSNIQNVIHKNKKKDSVIILFEAVLIELLIGIIVFCLIIL